MKTRGYLTRRSNGLYLLTYWPPAVTNVGSTDKQDAYPQPGDPFAFNNICEWSAQIIWGVKDLPVLKTVRVITQGEIEKHGA